MSVSSPSARGDALRRRGLDGITDATERMELALRGVFAGNIFDLGAAESTALFNAAGGVRCFSELLTCTCWAADLPSGQAADR